MTKRDELIINNLKLVNHVIWKKYPMHGKDDDMFQVGCIGLIKAADTYQEKNGSFSNWAIACIDNAIKMELRNQLTRDGHLTKVSIEEAFYEKAGEETDLTILDTLIGDRDVSFCDINAFISSLTDRQVEIVRLLQNGFKQVEIAQRLGVHKYTICKEVKEIRKKFDRAI